MTCENDNAAWDYDNGIYSTQMYTQRVQQILASHDPKPIFLYIAYQAVHSPLQALAGMQTLQIHCQHKQAGMLPCSPA